MSKHHLATVSWVAAAALLVSCAGADSFVRTADEAQPATRVQFTYQAVNPQTVTIAPTGNVSWENLSLDAVGFVIFPANIVSSLRCTELRPYLTKLENGDYRSVPITNSMASETAKLPCSLAPGSYDYEVWLMGEGFGEEGMSADPQQILHAKIVVQQALRRPTRVPRIGQLNRSARRRPARQHAKCPYARAVPACWVLARPLR